MGLLEKYRIEEEGSHPFLIRDSWQVSKLNYAKHYHIDHLNRLNKHQNSDRALVLLMGKATLVADFDSGFSCVSMERGTSYYVPRNVPYTIVMETGCELFSVESPHIHRDDVMECPLTNEQIRTIRENINKKP